MLAAGSLASLTAAPTVRRLICCCWALPLAILRVTPGGRQLDVCVELLGSPWHPWTAGGAPRARARHCAPWWRRWLRGETHVHKPAFFSQRWTSRSGLSGYLARNPVPPHGVRRCPVPSRGASGLGAMHAPRPAPQPISAGRLPTRFCAPSLIPLPLPPPPRARRPTAATRGAAARRAPHLCRI